jgi:hypothetical protein
VFLKTPRNIWSLSRYEYSEKPTFLALERGTNMFHLFVETMKEKMTG